MAHRLALAAREVHRPLAVRLLALHWLLGSGMFKIWCLVSPIGFTLSCLFMPLYDGVAHRLPYHHINRGPSPYQSRSFICISILHEVCSSLINANFMYLKEWELATSSRQTSSRRWIAASKFSKFMMSEYIP